MIPVEVLKIETHDIQQINTTEINADSLDHLHLREDLFLPQFSLSHYLPSCLN